MIRGYFLPWANTTARNYSSTAAGENLYYDTVQTPHPGIGEPNAVDSFRLRKVAGCRLEAVGACLDLASFR